MNIYDYLKKDHQTVLKIFDTILSSKSSDNREKLFQEIANELLVHAETENKTFYKALEKYEETVELIPHARKEHSEIKDHIEKLKHVSIDSDEWLEQFKEFKHSVSHHIEEEENKIFNQAKNVLSATQANQLAQDMQKLKDEIKESI